MIRDSTAIDLRGQMVRAGEGLMIGQKMDVLVDARRGGPMMVVLRGNRRPINRHHLRLSATTSSRSWNRAKRYGLATLELASRLRLSQRQLVEANFL